MVKALVASIVVCRCSPSCLVRSVAEGMGGAMLPNLDQLWYVEAEGYIVIDLTDALVNGHDVLNWTRPTTNS